MSESQHNDEMIVEVPQAEARRRAETAGHPEWENACARCGCRLEGITADTCLGCR